MPNFTPKRRPRYGSMPWSIARHRSRYSIAEQLRREYLGVPEYVPTDDELFMQVPPAARRDLRSGGRA